MSGEVRAPMTAVRLVRRGVYDVIVIDTLDRLAVTDAGRVAALRVLGEAGVRLLVARDGIDTGDPVGAGLIGSLTEV